MTDSPILMLAKVSHYTVFFRGDPLCMQPATPPGLAGTLGLKVFVTREKRVVLECLENPEILSILTTDPCSAGLHVLPMGKLSINVCG